MIELIYTVEMYVRFIVQNGGEQMCDINLFKERESKTEEICVRLTQKQKRRVVELSQLAGSKSATAYIISLIGAAHEKQITDSMPRMRGLDASADAGDDMPL